MSGLIKNSAVTAVVGLVGYFLIPVVALLTPAAAWDGNGPAFAETTLSDAFFWAMMASFAVFAISTCIAVVGVMIRLARRTPTRT